MSNCKAERHICYFGNLVYSWAALMDFAFSRAMFDEKPKFFAIEPPVLSIRLLRVVL
jgi:hypothetical protein